MFLGNFIHGIIAGGDGVLGEMGSQSALARLLVAHARGLASSFLPRKRRNSVDVSQIYLNYTFVLTFKE